MNYAALLESALVALMRNKLRSVLTILGITIGIAAVICVVAIIEFNNPDLKLFPGMTAYVTIPVATARNAVKVPNTALRYKPPMSPDEILATYKRYGIEASESEKAASDASSQATAAASQNLPRTPKTTTAVIWKLHADNSTEPVKVALGITDHAFTEVTGVLNGDLKEGDDLIIRTVVTRSQTPAGIRR